MADVHRPVRPVIHLVLLLAGLGATTVHGQGHEEDYDDADPWVGFEEREAGPTLRRLERL